MSRTAKHMAAITAAFVLCMCTAQCFAALSVDGNISPSEYEGANIQVQCENGNSGCGLYVLLTYYKPLDEQQIYLALGAELRGEEIDPQGAFEIEIYIDETPVIRVNAQGEAEYDEQLYAVQSGCIAAFSSLRCETVIGFKTQREHTPEIRVRVRDNEGVPSLLYSIDTHIESTQTQAEESGGESAAQKSTRARTEKKTTRSPTKRAASPAQESGSATDGTQAASYSLSEHVRIELEESGKQAVGKKSAAFIAAGTVAAVALTSAVLFNVVGKKPADPDADTDSGDPDATDN